MNRGSLIGKMKYLQKVNLNVLRKNPNTDLSFKMSKMERSSPFTIIPEKIYTDFNRKSFKRHTLLFPINIPVYYRRITSPKEYFRHIREQPLIANYAHLTGNQLLITLLRFSELDSQELSEIFFHLSVNQESKNLDLENNKIVKEATEHIISTMDGWTIEPLTKTVFSMFILGFKNEALWKKMRYIFINKIYAYEHISSTYFAEMFIMFFDIYKNDLLESERELLKEQLPRYLKKMRPDLYVKMFEMVLDLNLLTSYKEYMFERHFFMAFWKHSNLFGLDEAARILKGLRKLEYYQQDIEFYEKDFIPVIMKKAEFSNDNKALHSLYSELEMHLEFGINKNMIEDNLAMISQRLLYIEKKMKIIDQTDFIEIVKSDLKKFRRRKLEEMKVKTTSNEAQVIVN